VSDESTRPAAPALGRGGVIGICGPDGVGKTTLCEAVVNTVLEGQEVLHVRFPGLLPRRDPVKRREARLGAGGSPVSGDPAAFPERAYAPTYSLPKSVAKTLYLYLDFMLGWAVNVRPLLKRGGWVVFERGWWDHAVDARRYRLRSPGLVRALGRFIPAWDLVLILDAPPETIRARKPELPVEEIGRQARAWRQLLPARQRRAYLDASRPAADVLEQARIEIAAAVTPTRARRSSTATDRGWVLVTDGAKNRSALAAVRSLAAAGYRAAVAGPGASLAAASRHCAREVKVPATDDPGYAEALRGHVESGDYLTVLPASDRALVALDAPGAELLDKITLARRAEAAGLPTPPTRAFSSPDELVAHRDELEYPLIVKPTSERRVPLRVLFPRELDRESIPDGSLITQPFVDEPLRAVSGVAWRGRLVATVHQRYLRIWPPETGTVCAAVTVAPDRVLDEKLAALLDGYSGIFQAQFIGPYLLDVHPRVHGSMPIADAAGVNLVALYCDLLRGEEVGPVTAREGVHYRWLESDLSHIAFSWRTGSMGMRQALAALRPRSGTAHSTESLFDPKPILARLRAR
jgi:thymidylate kinase